MRRIESDDPYELVGVGFPSVPGYDHHATMARTFIEEFSLMGLPEEEIMQLFRNPHYRGPNTILSAKGEAYVRELIKEIAPREASDA